MKLYVTPVVLTATIIQLQIDAFQHMQHFVQTMQQQAQHAIATEDQQHKQELHKLMARSAPGPWTPLQLYGETDVFPEVAGSMQMTHFRQGPCFA